VAGVFCGIMALNGVAASFGQELLYFPFFHFCAVYGRFFFFDRCLSRSLLGVTQYYLLSSSSGMLFLLIR